MSTLTDIEYKYIEFVFFSAAGSEQSRREGESIIISY